jgi:hypothetical protein
MAFGNSIMSKFSDEPIALDPAYESLYDDSDTAIDEFIAIACEGADYDPYDPDYIDEDDDDYDEDDLDDEDEDDDDDFDEDAEDEESCCENAITDMTPAQRRANFFKMVDANPRFDAAKKKELKANYDKNHPDALSNGANESASSYDAAQAILNEVDEILANAVDDAYEDSTYEDDELDSRARYAAGLRTDYSRLNEGNEDIGNLFVGDRQARYASNLHTGYARESVDADIAYENAMAALNGDIDYATIDADAAYEAAIAALYGNNSKTRYEHEASDILSDLDGFDVDEGLENCRYALESMIQDLNGLTTI